MPVPFLAASGQIGHAAAAAREKNALGQTDAGQRNEQWLTKPDSGGPEPPVQNPANRRKILHQSGFLAKS